MIYTEEYFRWNTENKKNKDAVGGAHPYHGLYDKITLDYCYYVATEEEFSSGLEGALAIKYNYTI